MVDFLIEVHPSADRSPAAVSGKLALRSHHCPTVDSQVELKSSNCLCIRRDGVGSSSIVIPWRVDGFGEVVLQTGSLVSRPTPYRLAVELARGEITRLRNLLADMEMRGKAPAAGPVERVHRATLALHRAIRADGVAEAEKFAEESLRDALTAAEELTVAQSEALLASREIAGRRGRIGVVLHEIPESAEAAEQLVGSVHHVFLPVRWAQLEPKQGSYQWDSLDRRLAWCHERGLSVCLGPIIVLRPGFLPEWLMRWTRDFHLLLTLMTDWLETVVCRYQDKVREWETTAGYHAADWLPMDPGQRVQLVSRLTEVAADVAPGFRVAIGVDQPFCEDSTLAGRAFSPFASIDLMSRSPVRFSALSLETAFGYSPGGTYCRSLADLSRMLDHFGELGLPIWLKLFHPSGDVSTNGDGDGCVCTGRAGVWRRPPDPQLQADWLEQSLLVALAKPFVERVSCGNFQDSPERHWPLAGLLDEGGRPKPSLLRVQQLVRRLWN